MGERFGAKLVGIGPADVKQLCLLGCFVIVMTLS